jgi:hypothetical protein
MFPRHAGHGTARGRRRPNAGTQCVIGFAWREDRSAAGELTAAAVQWLLRGRTWEALAHEVAWAAVAATREPPEAMEWLTPLVDARLADRLHDVRQDVVAAMAATRADYERAWPNDVGAETAAELAGRDAAERALGGAYYATVEWAAGLLLERRAATVKRRRFRRRGNETIVGEFPAFVIDRTAAPEPVGWSRRAAA